jgi:hypothetical protein
MSAALGDLGIGDIPYFLSRYGAKFSQLKARYRTKAAKAIVLRLLHNMSATDPVVRGLLSMGHLRTLVAEEIKKL